MRIGLFDVDANYRGKVTHPNIALMKLSSWHKQKGDTTEFVQPGEHYDKVYISKVFSDGYTREQLPFFTADEIIRGGAGYAIDVEDGREVYHKELDAPLPFDVEHTYPDYGLYGITDNAYGYLTRGCPRGCNFCHIAGMQGRISHKVADLSEFWRGQSTIHLCDPNILACKDWDGLFKQLIDSNAFVDFNQGLDVRLLTDEKAEALNRVRYKMIHFAWDRPEEDLRPQLENAKRMLKKCSKTNTTVYILCNNGESFEDDIQRVEFVKRLGMQPYVTIYRADTANKELKRLRRYSNNPYVCWATPTFADYDVNAHSDRFGKTGMKHKGKANAMI